MAERTDDLLRQIISALQPTACQGVVQTIAGVLTCVAK